MLYDIKQAYHFETIVCERQIMGLRVNHPGTVYQVGNNFRALHPPEFQHVGVIQHFPAAAGYVQVAPPRRHEYTSLGFNGLNGRAEFYQDGVPSDRGQRFYDLIQPWQQVGFDGDYFLICGQVLGDASLAHVDYPAWVNALPVEHAGKPVLFRPHPLGSDFVIPHETLGGDLAAALEGAQAVWTYNSTSAVDAMLAGVPVCVADRGSMVYSAAAHEMGFGHWMNQHHLVDELAYCQWTVGEIEDGTAWDHLRQRYEHC